MWSLIVSAIIIVRVVLLFKFINKRNKPAILGIYQQRNKFYYLKFIFAYILLQVRKLIKHVKKLISFEGELTYDGAIHVQREDMALEEKHSLGNYPQSVDAVYFNGVSKDGSAIICYIARRPKGYCDAFFFVKIAGEELLLSPNLPDTCLQQEPEEEGDYKVQGMSASNFTPMRLWKVAYNGEMKSKDTQKILKVEAQLSWSAGWSPYNYDHQMSAWSVAGDMAREPWSRNYFNLLEKFHQTHYEQMGYFQGTVTVDGKQHQIDMPAVRDHSFGTIRDWRSYHRYAIHFIFLENGDCMEVGTVSQPIIFSHLTIGYYCNKSSQVVYPVDSCDFQLYQHGETAQILPKDYGFSFNAGNNTYYVQVNVNHETTLYIGQNRDAKLYERWCSVEVNGVKGWAFVEWQYNNVQDNDTK